MNVRSREEEWGVAKEAKLRSRRLEEKKKRRQGIFSVSLRLTLFLLPLLSLFSSVSSSVYFFFPFLSFLLLFFKLLCLRQSVLCIYFFLLRSSSKISIHLSRSPSVSRQEKKNLRAQLNSSSVSFDFICFLCISAVSSGRWAFATFTKQLLLRLPGFLMKKINRCFSRSFGEVYRYKSFLLLYQFPRWRLSSP